MTSRLRPWLLAALLLASALTMASGFAALRVAERAFGPTDPRVHARTVSLVYAAPRPDAPRRLLWRVEYRVVRRIPRAPGDTAEAMGVYVTPVGRPVGVFPLGMRWHPPPPAV